ncbi:hypothetical protein Celaphus_00004913 [Cervus elaphus hippelaphus]|uniref:Paternally-expressed gene 3 protein n=1 Tax=Cervus elaphus hippelaphus TaxID=46360 RepID=A0A212DDP8_CEREH|nr:hypothetical protein Celaphus_00004913 [Cervus elaphus hippelaphus]
MLPPKSLSATKPKKSWAPNQYELDSDLSEPDAVPGEGATDSEFFHQRFRNFLYVEFLGPRKTLLKLRNLCLDWLQPEIRTKEEIIEVLVLEQYLTILPEKIKPWVQARKPDNCEELVALLEDYEEMYEPEDDNSSDTHSEGGVSRRAAESPPPRPALPCSGDRDRDQDWDQDWERDRERGRARERERRRGRNRDMESRDRWPSVRSPRSRFHQRDLTLPLAERAKEREHRRRDSLLDLDARSEEAVLYQDMVALTEDHKPQNPIQDNMENYRKLLSLGVQLAEDDGHSHMTQGHSSRSKRSAYPSTSRGLKTAPETRKSSHRRGICEAESSHGVIMEKFIKDVARSSRSGRAREPNERPHRLSRRPGGDWKEASFSRREAGASEGGAFGGGGFSCSSDLVSKRRALERKRRYHFDAEGQGPVHDPRGGARKRPFESGGEARKAARAVGGSNLGAPPVALSQPPDLGAMPYVCDECGRSFAVISDSNPEDSQEARAYERSAYERAIFHSLAAFRPPRGLREDGEPSTYLSGLRDPPQKTPAWESPYAGGRHSFFRSSVFYRASRPAPLDHLAGEGPSGWKRDGEASGSSSDGRQHQKARSKKKNIERKNYDTSMMHTLRFAETSYTEEPAQTSYIEELAQTSYTEEPAQTSYTEEPAEASYTEKPAQTSYAEEPAQTSYAEEPAQTSYAEEPAQTSYAEEPAQTSYIEEPAQTSYTEEPAQASYIEEPAQASYTEEPAEASYTEKPAQASYAEEPAQASYAEEPAQASYIEEPAQASYAEEPAQTSYAEEPAQTSYIEEPAQASYAEEPAQTSYAEEPAQTSYAEEPAQTSYAEEPAQTSYIEEPAQISYIEEPAQTSYIEELVQTSYTEEPAQTSYAEEPAQTRYAEEPAQTRYAEEPAQASYAEEPAQARYAEEPAQARYAEEPPAETSYAELVAQISYAELAAPTSYAELAATSYAELVAQISYAELAAPTSYAELAAETSYFEPPAQASYTEPAETSYADPAAQVSFEEPPAEATYADLSAEISYAELATETSYAELAAQISYDEPPTETSYAELGAQISYSEPADQTSYAELTAQTSYSEPPAQTSYAELTSEASYCEPPVLNECKECGECFATVEELARHQKIYARENFHDGKLFGEPVMPDLGLDGPEGEEEETEEQDEQEEQDEPEEPEDSIYGCKDCGLGFADRADLRDHQKVHRREPLVESREYTRPAVHAPPVSEYQKDCLGEQLYECPACGESFVHSSFLFEHQKVHEQDQFYGHRRYEPFMQPLIAAPRRPQAPPKSVPFGAALQCQGAGGPEGGRPDDELFKCDVCGQLFSDRLSLARHQNTHTG